MAAPMSWTTQWKKWSQKKKTLVAIWKFPPEIAFSCVGWNILHDFCTHFCPDLQCEWFDTIVAESQSQSADLGQLELTDCCVQNDLKVWWCVIISKISVFHVVKVVLLCIYGPTETEFLEVLSIMLLCNQFAKPELVLCTVCLTKLSWSVFWEMVGSDA